MTVEDTDRRLRVTASGVVHLPSCPRLRNNNASTSAWAYRFDHDRACKVCTPVLPERTAR